ncbi:MAG: XdhC family protein, partial [Opitutae bacterium]
GHSSYIAFVGSRKKFASLHKKLQESGIGDNLLDNIRSPAGLDIKAILPEEIALSIMAEIIQTRRNLGAEVSVVGA